MAPCTTVRASVTVHLPVRRFSVCHARLQECKYVALFCPLVATQMPNYHQRRDLTVEYFSNDGSFRGLYSSKHVHDMGRWKSTLAFVVAPVQCHS